MGLLDDAIREHLELKRRHGAEPGEIAKLEHEAFGPVRRGDALEVPSADLAPEPEPADEPTPLADEPAFSESAAGASEDLYEEEWEYADDSPPTAGAHVAESEPEPPAAAAPPAAPDVPPPAPPRPESEVADRGQETVAFSLDEIEDAERREPPASRPSAEPEAPVTPPAPPRDEDVIAADEEPGEEEDVLEETPDFLQETPEHDRLWFEQKPPRDFDF